MKPIILIGYRQDVPAYIAAAKSQGREIVGIVDRFFVGKNLDGLRVLGSDLDLLDSSTDIFKNKDNFDWFVSTMFLGVTNTKNDNENTWLLRQERIGIAEQSGVNLTNIVHATAHIDPTCKLGKNVFVGWLAYVGAHCSVGDFTFIGGYVGLSHHVTCGTNCTFTSTTGIVGNTVFGNNFYVGPGCTIARRQKSATVIGNNVMIGPGCTVIKSLQDNTVQFTNGAVRTNTKFNID